MSTVRFGRVVAALVVGVLLALGAATQAFAAPVTIRVLDLGAPSLGQSLPIAAPTGGTFSADPGRALIRVTRGGGAVSEITAWCVESTRTIDQAIDYTSSLQTPADTPELAGPGYQAAGWLMGSADGLIAAAADTPVEAAAIQIAVWQLTGQAADVAAPTPNAAINARVAQLRALAAGKVLVSALAVSVPAGPATVGAPMTLTFTGTPGAIIDVVVSSGTATLSSARVTLGPSGGAPVTVTPSAAGDFVVTATAKGSTLERATFVPGTKAHQALAFVTPITLATTAKLTAALAALPSPPSIVGVPVTVEVPAALKVTKVGQANVRRGRMIHYKLTITNSSTQTAKRVVVRDQLPVGTALRRVPDRARLVSGAVVWRIDAIAPGARVTLRLVLRTDAVALGDLVNVASVAAENAATVRAQTTTRVVSAPRVIPAVVAPAVTG